MSIPFQCLRTETLSICDLNVMRVIGCVIQKWIPFSLPPFADADRTGVIDFPDDDDVPEIAEAPWGQQTYRKPAGPQEKPPRGFSSVPQGQFERERREGERRGERERERHASLALSLVLILISWELI